MGTRWDGGSVNAINLPHRPTFIFETKGAIRNPVDVDRLSEQGRGWWSWTTSTKDPIAVPWRWGQD